MTAFTQLKQADGTLVDFEPEPHEPAKRPPRWSLSNWPVRWKVLAIVLVPLLLAGVFGGLRISSSATAAGELRRSADRAELIPDINTYMGALEDALVAGTVGGDTQAALAEYASRKTELQDKLGSTDVIPDVRLAVTTLLDYGQNLIDRVNADSIDLRQRVTTYVPLLLTAETAITGSVRTDDEDVQLQAEGLSRAIGARGQMAMQQMLVSQGGQLPEPDLRTSMVTLAGTEPSTIAGMGKLLGGASEQASTLRSEMVKRMSVLSDPAAVLVGNPELLQSQQVTDQIAQKVIDDTVTAIPASVRDEANAQRATAIRDALLVLAAILIAAVVVWLVARSLIRPLRTLRDSALKVAHDDLAQEIERVRGGGEPGPVRPIPVHTTEEVGQVAHAVDELHQQAVLLAGEQAQLQLQVADMFETLSRRSRSLVDQQLSLIDSLERNEEDPQRLESLFRLDHLAARMRRNGANLLVLAGAKIPREQAGPVPVSTILNAAASEVEDYTRVVTATVPDAEIVGAAAGDLIHMLAELLDNALRYSPPVSQVRVSGVHAGNGALVIEVSDIGLGMTESDLRVANTRLRSGGEVNPYTARHMGLFVVGRLAAQHGLVVRLRTTIDGEPSSGTTAGIYVPAQLIARSEVSDQQPVAGLYSVSNGAAEGYGPSFTLDEAYDDTGGYVNGYADGLSDVPVSLLPQRNPGASGISEIPPPGAPVGPLPARQEQEWPQDPMPAARSGAETAPEAFTDTSAFFTSRPQDNGVPRQVGDDVWTPDASTGRNGRHGGPAAAPEDTYEPSPTAGEGDAIYQKMLSEWLIDPTEIARSTDLHWESVWDHGWSVAAAADEAPVARHTEDGLPVREPGARLVPGAADTDAEPNGRHRNGGAHRSGDGDDHRVASAAETDAGVRSAPLRDPDAVRASISNHFGGVHAGRSHARQSRGTDSE